ARQEWLDSQRYGRLKSQRCWGNVGRHRSNWWEYWLSGWFGCVEKVEINVYLLRFVVMVGYGLLGNVVKELDCLSSLICGFVGVSGWERLLLLASGFFKVAYLIFL